HDDCQCSEIFWHQNSPLLHPDIQCSPVTRTKQLRRLHELRSPKAKTTGPYTFVRHPMYADALVTLVGIPLALGSWWELPALLLILPVLIWRLPDEERFLRQNLPG